MDDKAALILFSGGQDSATCLAWALARFDRVETVGYAYGQRHAIELECRADLRDGFVALKPEWRTKLVDDHTIDIPTLGALSDTALTREVAMAIGDHGLPNTFVPGRNLLFLTYAAALAWRRGISTLVGGMCETDFSGYPDCRNETMQAMARALSLGLDRQVQIETPLMWLTKAATWELADELGGDPLVRLIVDETVTCYEGDRTHTQAWGTGCGKCPACNLRRKGYEEWQAQSGRS